VLVTGNQRVSLWQFREPLTVIDQFFDKAGRMFEIVRSNIVADAKQVEPRRIGNDNFHTGIQSLAARWLRNAFRTSFGSCTRPASASAMPGTIAASKAAKR
jgi:hypothetical protein